MCHICAVGKGPFGTKYLEILRVCNSLPILCPIPILRVYDKSVPPIPGSHPLKSEIRSLFGLHAKVLHPHLCQPGRSVLEAKLWTKYKDQLVHFVKREDQQTKFPNKCSKKYTLIGPFYTCPWQANCYQEMINSVLTLSCKMDLSLFCDRYAWLENDHLEWHILKTAKVSYLLAHWTIRLVNLACNPVLHQHLSAIRLDMLLSISYKNV